MNDNEEKKWVVVKHQELQLNSWKQKELYSVWEYEFATMWNVDQHGLPFEDEVFSVISDEPLTLEEAKALLAVLEASR